MDSSDKAYKELLKNRMEVIEKQISELQKCRGSIVTLMNNVDKKILGLKIEHQTIADELKNNTPREITEDRRERIIQVLSKHYDKNVDKADGYHRQIEELKKSKNSLSSNHSKRLVDKKISRLNEKILDLKNSNISFVNTQRKIMYSKYQYKFKKQQLLSKAMGNIKYYSDLYKDNEVLKGITNDSISGAIKRTAYSIKGYYYGKKLEKSNEILMEMQSQSSLIKMYGARFAPLKRKIAERLKNRENDEESVLKPSL